MYQNWLNSVQSHLNDKIMAEIYPKESSGLKSSTIELSKESHPQSYIFPLVKSKDL